MQNILLIHCFLNSDGSFLERTLEGPFSPGIAGRVMSYADEEPSPTTPNEIYDTPPDSAGHSPCQSVDGVGGIVTIVLFPDQGQKYGFNVTGTFIFHFIPSS